MKKKAAAIALCFLILTTSAFAELEVSDLEKIQSIVDKSVSKVEKSIETSEKHIKQYIDLKVETLDGRLKQIFTLVIALIALIAVAVGMPQILVARQGKEMQTQVQQIKALQQEIEKLKRERMTGPE